MSIFIFFIINIISNSNSESPLFILKKMPIDDQKEKKEIALTLFYKYSSTLYIGHPPQKINNVLGLDDGNYSFLVFGNETEYVENACDINKIYDIYNYSFFRDINNSIMEYAIINTSISLGTYTDNSHNNIVYALQSHPDFIFPFSGKISIDYFCKERLVYEQINSEKSVIFFSDISPQNYDLRYKKTSIKKMGLTLLKISKISGYGLFEYFSLDFSSFITLNSKYYYLFIDSLLGCSSETINNYTYYFCSPSKDLSDLKIEFLELILNENDLVYQTNKYKIPLIRFGEVNDNIIKFSIFMMKKSFYLEKHFGGSYYYLPENNINMPLNIIDNIPFHKSFDFNQKSLDGDDIFPLRFIYSVERSLLDNLIINFDFKFSHAQFQIELIVITEDHLELLQKGILLEYFFNQKYIFNTLQFSINKLKILSLMKDEQIQYYLYFIIKKHEANKLSYNYLKCELSINFQSNNIIDYGKSIIGYLGLQKETQLFLRKNNILLRRAFEEKESNINEILILQISLEDNLDFSIINKTLLESYKDDNYFYKNSTKFRFVEEYPDKIIVYINLFEKNIDDLMINIFKKNFDAKSENSGYKIKYNIGKIFHIPYYNFFNGQKISYQKIIKNDKLKLLLKIPNVKQIFEYKMENFANLTFIIKIFELNKNLDIKVKKPLIYTDSYNQIFYMIFNSTDDNIIIKELNDIKINKNKKYVVTVSGNITDYDDIIEYDSFLFETDEEDEKNSLNVLAIVLPIIAVFILIILATFLIYKKNLFCFRKKETETIKINPSEIQMVEKLLMS